MEKILIVDDEKNIRSVLKGLLEKNGFKDILTAENGKQAMAVLEEESVAAIISDLQMPEMDGMTLFKKTRSLAVPFIIITAL